MMNRLSTALVAFFLLSCGREKEVKWEALSALDNLSIALENAAYEHAHDKQVELLEDAQKLMEAAVESVPDKVKNPEQVAVLIEDLKALSASVEGVHNLSQKQLDGLSKSLHPIVAKLMESAGVPHVHATGSAHDASSCTDPTHNH